MSSSVQNTVILFKSETTAGTDAAPVAGTDAAQVRVSNLSVKFDQRMADRDVLVGGFAAVDKLPYARRGTISFSVDLQASGTLGVAPQWGEMLLCCGFAETVTATTRVDYLPASSALKTATIWAYIGGRLEKFTYCAGTFKLSLEVGKVPSIDFTFTGLVASTVGAAPATPTLTAWIRPEAVGPSFTTALSAGAVTYSAGALAGGTTYPFRSFVIDMANDVQDLELVTAESIAIQGRDPKADIVADFGGSQHSTFKSDMHAGTPRAFGVVHGSTGTKKVGIYVPVGVLTAVEDQVDGNVMIDKVSLTLRPSVLNDELRIFCI